MEWLQADPSSRQSVGQREVADLRTHSCHLLELLKRCFLGILCPPVAAQREKLQHNLTALIIIFLTIRCRVGQNVSTITHRGAVFINCVAVWS